MQNLPTAEVYEKEFKYFPWGKLVDEVLEFSVKEAPLNAKVLDIFCGPGYLLGKIRIQRPDLDCLGVDFEAEYISYAKKLYPDIKFEVGDALIWESEDKYDLILVTAGLHHLPYESQEGFVRKVSEMLESKGTAIIADPYIDDFNDEEERKLAAEKLGNEYLSETIKNDATPDIIKAVKQIMENDIRMVEFKSSIKKMRPVFQKYFKNVEVHKTWPSNDTEYGDYYFILNK